MTENTTPSGGVPISTSTRSMTDVVHIVENSETVRRRKDGERIEVSLTVSPVRNEAGEILGASKTARNITAQKRAAAQQLIMLREMHHRIKNLSRWPRR